MFKRGLSSQEALLIGSTKVHYDNWVKIQSYPKKLMKYLGIHWKGFREAKIDIRRGKLLFYSGH